MKKQTVGILGLGEVGRAIKKLCQKQCRVLTKDLDHDQLGNEKLDILHICIHFNPQFIKTVCAQIKKNKPNLLVINSTVIPGTSEKIKQKTKAVVIHSPIIGIHPHLYKQLFTFPKLVGPTSKRAADLAVKHFKKLGLKTVVFKKAEETELAKIMSTTYYGLSIVFCKWLKELCDGNKLDFENVYTKFNQAYNKGYAEELPNVRRPVLKPTPGKIGGHCIIANTQALKKHLKDPFSQLILKLNESFTNGNKD